MGVQVTVTPAAGIAATLHVGLAAGLGPLLVHVIVPFTGCPALAVAGKPEAVACISDTGDTANGRVSVLLGATGSGVALPAVVVMLSVPLAGAVKVDEHVIDCPTANGLGSGLGAQVCVAPPGRPDSAQAGEAAALGPALVHTPLTVTGWPAVTLGGTLVVARMSACGVTVAGACAVLLALLGSAVLVPAVPVTVTVPEAGTGYDTAQLIALPTGSEDTGELGVQFTLAPGGSPPTLQVALAAALGPLLVQVTVPVAVLPAAGLVGKPLTAAAMSACGVTAIGRAVTLLAVFGSDVVEPAVVLTFSAPLVGAVKLALQVILWPTGNGLGAGLGVQVCGVPGGRPESAQVGAAAGLGPLLVHTPLTFTVWPAVTVAGAVVVDCMSACSAIAVDACAWLLPGLGSAVVEPAVPVIVMPPDGGTV